MRTLIRNAEIINEGRRFHGDILIEGEFIAEIGPVGLSAKVDREIDATGLLALPGVIDDQVHFREPGLTHKANIFSESRAALAGGVTSFMEMPNVIPQTSTIDLLEEKNGIGDHSSAVNYSFFMGALMNNLEEIKKVDPRRTCGVKIFMGSSTGNMLVDDETVLRNIFSISPVLIATHCEQESRVRSRMASFLEKYGEDMPVEMHPQIRDEEACYNSSSLAVALAKDTGARLHILHISTGIETGLFTNALPLKEKKITAEVCVHHLHFTSDDYAQWGNKIKCNPAIKSPNHRDAIWEALLDDRLDIIATDHAPHTLEEKSVAYAKSPSGLPLIQHSLQLMLEYAAEGKIPYERVVEKMCHAPADCFLVQKRGYLRPGYFADIVLVDPNHGHTVTRENLLYKCGWSPLEGTHFKHSINKVFVNGTLSWDRGITGEVNAQRILFDR